MLLSLMVYVTVVSLLLALAAWTCERGLRGIAVATRWIWASALGGSLGFTLFVLPRPGASPLPLEGVAPDALPGPFAPSVPELTGGLTLPAGLDPDVGTAWLVLSLVVGFALLRAQIGLSSERTTWTRMELGTRSILVAENFGPAVVGLFRSVIVMPRWALDMTGDEQELMLRHEAEHRTRRGQCGAK